MRRPRAGRDVGAMAVELIAFVPVLALLTLLLVQGFLAASALGAVQDAARDGARAAVLGRDVSAAVSAELPDWVELRALRRYGCDGECVEVVAAIPIGIPGMSLTEVTVTRSAELPAG